MEEFILLSYYPICVSGTDRVNLGKGKVGGAWESFSYYPIILSVFVGSGRTDFSKNPRFRSDKFFILKMWFGHSGGLSYLKRVLDKIKFSSL